MDSLSAVISALAFVVSAGSLAVAYATDRRAHMPVLQFVWKGGADGAVGADGGWLLVNVGTGPALNVIVAQADRTSLRRGTVGERWFSPVLVPAIPPNGSARLDWLDDDVAALGATYTDADRYFFTTKCGEDVSMFLIGLHLPRWPLLRARAEKTVPQWWSVHGLLPGRWSEVGEDDTLRYWWLPGRYGLSRRMGGWADPVSRYRGGPGPYAEP
jgi:hypothetical protein